MAADLRSKIATPAAGLPPKAVQDVDLYIARSLMILQYESKAPYYKDDPHNLQQILEKVINSDPYIDELLDSIEPSSRSKIFLRNIRSAWSIRKKYAAAGKIKPYTAVLPEEKPEDIRAITEILARTGSTVLSSDYTWNPEKIGKLPDTVAAIEAAAGKPIKIEIMDPPDNYLHREKKMYFDTQLWISLQIQPVIKIYLDK